MREVLISKVYRTGMQAVEREGDRYFVTLKNRTNDTRHEVPIETARRFYSAIKKDRDAR